MTMTIDDVFGASTGKKYDDKPSIPIVKVPGDFRRRGVNGPPMIASCRKDATIVKSGERKGRPELDDYARPSGYTEQIENMYALTKYEQRVVAHGFGVDPTLATRSAELAREATSLIVREQSDEWKKKADGIHKAAFRAGGGELRADQGTHVHYVTELHDLGKSWLECARQGIDLGIPEEATSSMLAAFVAMCEHYDLEILAVEIRLVNDRYKVAGTADRIVRLRRDLRFVLASGEVVELAAGTVLIFDTKTGKVDVEHCHGYCCQLFLYMDSCGYDTETETRHELDWQLDRRWGLIAHVPVEVAIAGEQPFCNLVLVDLDLGRMVAECARSAYELYDRNDGFAVALAEDDGPAPAWERVGDLVAAMTRVEPEPVAVSEPRADAVNAAEASQMSGECLTITHDGVRMRPMDSTNDDPFDGLAGPAASERPGPRWKRDYLNRRIAALRDANQLAFSGFAALAAESAIPKLSQSDGHTVGQLRAIEDMLIAVECAHNIRLDVFDVPPCPKPDEGRTLSQAEVDEMGAWYVTQDQAARAASEAWAIESEKAGILVRFSTARTARRVANTRARIAVGSPDLDPEQIRAAVAYVTHEDWPLFSSIPLGAVLGALTIDEANRLAELAPALPTAEYRVDMSNTLWLAAA